jgi:predicted RNA-binding protein with RPS1 domain
LLVGRPDFGPLGPKSGQYDTTVKILHICPPMRGFLFAWAGNIQYIIMTTATEEKKDDVVEEEELDTTAAHPMSAMITDSPNPPIAGDLVEGTVIALLRNAVYVDLAPFGTGIIYGREFLNARDVIRHSNVGDSITAKVVETENEDGYIELSLKEARQALIWNDAEEAIKNKSLIELTVKEANKGGLIVVWQGIEGFLPASQLSTEHYPRVEDGDKDKTAPSSSANIPWAMRLKEK